MSKRAIVFALLGLVVLVLALLALGWFPQGVLRTSLESRLRAALAATGYMSHDTTGRS